MSDPMMGDGGLKKPDAAQGTAAAKLFLNQMMVHHESAAMMAKTEIGQGKSPDAVVLG